MSRGKGRPFLPGHSVRPTKGVRNRLAKVVFEDILRHWQEPEINSTKCKGQVALELMYRERPAEYLRLAASVLPKEFQSGPAEFDLADDVLDDLIADLKRRHAEQRESSSVRRCRCCGSSRSRRNDRRRY